MIHIDGSKGEGGGQVLRTALSLSLVTGSPFTIDGIRKGRSKPGILKQHLTAIRAAATVGQAKMKGDAIGSSALTFFPGLVRGGRFTFAVGTAGSATLVFQTVFPALLAAGEATTAVFEGGTHNPAAPPFDALASAFLPICRRMGADVQARLESRGFYPAGGGHFTVDVRPSKLGALELVERGALVRRRVTAVSSQIPEHVAAREIETVALVLGWRRDVEKLSSIAPASPGPGNAVVVTLEHEHVTEVFTAFGERGKRAEAVAREVADEVQSYLDGHAPVGPHLADQLIVPMLVGGGGRFVTGEPTGHLRTQVETVRAVVGDRVAIEPIERGAYEVRVRGLAD
ncbi:MAG TPA: RNA 3'-terminal phosphate cyclase [Polyangiaceae bacterium]|nr:RNA 3'-terminal phosphate cyclase [Polyangiaceae bacterium]